MRFGNGVVSSGRSFRKRYCRVIFILKPRLAFEIDILETFLIYSQVIERNFGQV